MSEHDTSAHSRNTFTLLEAVDQEGNGIDRPGLHASQSELPENETFGDVLGRNMARRAFLLGAAASVPVLMAGVTVLPSATEAAVNDGLNFKPISPSTVDQVVVPVDYFHEVILKWGDPLFAGAPAFNSNKQTAAAQKQQFGYNCDFVGYFPLQRRQPRPAARSITNTRPAPKCSATMFRAPTRTTPTSRSPRMAARWSRSSATIPAGATSRTRSTTAASPATRRCCITGPAAGHKLMKTTADPTGKHVLGMLNNCSGGKTPWGTWLTCEENFNQYFANNDTDRRCRRQGGACPLRRVGRRDRSGCGKSSTTASTAARSRTRRSASAG